MATANNRWERIRRYITGDLSGEEQGLFEEEARKDKGLAEGLALELTLQQGGRQSREAARKAIGRRRQRRQWLRIVGMAGLLALALAAWWWWQSRQELFRPDEGLKELNAAIAMEVENSYLRVAGKNQWQAWLVSGRQQPENYGLAADYFAQELEGLGCRQSDFQYYYGLLLLLYERDYGQAVEKLSCALSLGFAQNRPTLPYWLALAHLGAGDPATARQLLTEYEIPLSSLPARARAWLKE